MNIGKAGHTADEGVGTTIPAAAVTRPRITPVEAGGHEYPMAMGSDGTLWAGRAAGMSRYDGKAWTAAGPEIKPYPRRVPGKGAMLGWANGLAALYAGDKAMEAKGIEPLISENRAAFTAAFGGALEPRVWRTSGGSGAIAIDGGGRVFIAENHNQLTVTSNYGMGLRVGNTTLALKQAKILS